MVTFFLQAGGCVSLCERLLRIMHPQSVVDARVRMAVARCLSDGLVAACTFLLFFDVPDEREG